MSTFDGFLREYPLVSVDRFEDANLSSTTFFLSHCHTDHMKGLHGKSFKTEIIKRFFSKIYMSNVSKLLLKNSYSSIYNYFQVIPIETPTIISVPNESGKEITKLTVTLLPAGHCPGSVMFLFEGDNGNVLYTGDFRLEAGSCERLKHLHSTNGTVKPLRKLYVDTTFCDPMSLFIPSREECFDAISQLIKPWIDKGPNHTVFLVCPAKYGYEYAFIGLHKKFGMKVHVTGRKLRDYIGVPEIMEAVTSDPNRTQIHSCWEDDPPETIYLFGETNCGYCAPNTMDIHVRRIKLSVMFFTSSLYVNDIYVYDELEELFKACFSTHSSLYEIMDMVNYLQPKALHANVVPKKNTQESVLQHLWPLLKKENNENKETNFILGTLLQSVKNDDDSATESFGSLNFDCSTSSNVKIPLKSKDSVFRNDKNHEDIDASDVTNSQSTNQGCSSSCSTTRELAFTSDGEKYVSNMCKIDENSGNLEINELQTIEESIGDVNKTIAKDLNFDCNIILNTKSLAKSKNTVLGNDENHGDLDDLDASDVTHSQSTNQGSSSEIDFTSDDEKYVGNICEIDKNSVNFTSNQLQFIEENNEVVNRSIKNDFPKWNYSSSDDENYEVVETKTDDKSATKMSHDSLHKKCDTSVINNSKNVTVENSLIFDSMSSWSYSSSCGGYTIQNNQSDNEPEIEKRSCWGLAKNKNVDAIENMPFSNEFPEWQFSSNSHDNEKIQKSEINKNKTSTILSSAKLPCNKLNNAVGSSKSGDNTVENVFSPKWSYLPSDDDDEIKSKYVNDSVHSSKYVNDSVHSSKYVNDSVHSSKSDYKGANCKTNSNIPQRKSNKMFTRNKNDYSPVNDSVISGQFQNHNLPCADEWEQNTSFCADDEKLHHLKSSMETFGKSVLQKTITGNRQKPSPHLSDHVGRYHFPPESIYDADPSKTGICSEITKLFHNNIIRSAYCTLSSTRETSKSPLFEMSSQICDISERRNVAIESNSPSTSRILDKVSLEPTASPGCNSNESDEESLDGSPSILSSLNEIYYVHSLTEKSNIIQECLSSDDAIAGLNDGSDYEPSLTKDVNNYIFSATETKRARLCDRNRLNSNNAAHQKNSIVSSTSSSYDDIPVINLD